MKKNPPPGKFKNISEILAYLDEKAGTEPGELEGLLESGFDRLKEFLSSSESVGKEISEKIKSEVREWSDSAESKAKEYSKNVQSSMHDNPWPWLGGALGLGVLIGIILGRRD